LYDLLAYGVENEKKKNNYEFEREDIAGIVDYITEQLSNEVKLLSGKIRSVSFGAVTWQIAHALSARSKASFKEHKITSHLHFPCVSSIQKAKAENRVSDGRNTKVYEMRAATLQASDETAEYVYAMVDEVQMKDGVIFHSASGASMGLENNTLDISEVLHHLLSKGNGMVEKARKANQ